MVAVRSNQKRIYEGEGGGGSEGISKKTRVTTSERRKEREKEREGGGRRSGEGEEGERERERETRHGEKNDRHTRRQKEGRYVEVARLRGRSVPERNGDITRNEERGIGSYRKVERGDNETTREGWRQREAE